MSFAENGCFTVVRFSVHSDCAQFSHVHYTVLVISNFPFVISIKKFFFFLRHRQFETFVTTRNFWKLQYKYTIYIVLGYKKSEISCSIQKLNFHYDFISKIELTFWQLRAKPMAYFTQPWCLLGGYSAQVIRKCIDYELKSTDNPYLLTNFCKLLSLTY